MVDRKIPGSVRPAESAGFFLPQNSKETLVARQNPTTIYYAGQSPRRKHCIESLFPRTEVLTFNVEPEPVAPVEDVVHHKVNVVLNHPSFEAETGGIIVAADTQSITPSLYAGKLVDSEAKSKPSSEGEVVELFRSMSNTTDLPYYTVKSASVIHDVSTGQRSAVLVEETNIGLDQTVLRYLATAEGFDEYRRVFAAFYSSDVYSRNGLPQIGICDISSGLSLPVLSLIGAINNIDGIVSNNEELFKEAFKRSLQVVAIGIPLGLFEGYSLGEWVWTDEVTNAVLK